MANYRLLGTQNPVLFGILELHQLGTYLLENQVLSVDTKGSVGEGIKDNIRSVSTGPTQRKKAVLGHMSQNRS